jgi:hypothetical protein
MKKEYFSVLVLLFFLLFYTHSNGQEDYSFGSSAKKDYEKLIELQQGTEQTFLQTHDFDIKINGCDNVINHLNKFLKRYPDDERSDKVATALESWKSQKITFNLQLNSLINDLSSLLSKKAAEAAFKKHKMSKIEAIDLISQDKHTDGNKLFLTNVYTVRMKGKIIGKTISKLSISTSGSINIEDKSTLINDKAQIEE